MIVRISGKLSEVGQASAVLERDGMGYEVAVPAYAREELVGRIGQQITLHTFQYIEGSAVGANLYPRLVGFLSEADRAFFLEFIKVKGLGVKKALRAFAKPASWIAAVIEQGDAKLLATLPEVGKRSAELLIQALRGRLDRFAAREAGPPGEGLNQAEREALEILIQLGERRPDAMALIRQVTERELAEPDPARIVEAVYRIKSGLI